MMLKIGKLYSCEEYFLMFYPDKDTATAAAALAADAPAIPAAAAAQPRNAAYWTRRLGKPVSYLEKSIPFLVLNVEENLVLNVEENFYEVLAGDKKGWIIIKDWFYLKEIV